MSLLSAPSRALAHVALLLIVGLLAPLARASDYGRDVGGDFDDPVWTRDAPGDADYATDVGPPGSGDTATLGGSDAVTASGGAVTALASFVDFIVNGDFSATSYVSSGTLQGSGTLTVQSVPVGVTVEGGNLVVADCPGSIVVNGGSLTSPNYHAHSLNLDMGGVATLTSATTDLNADVAGGSSLTVPGIVNGMDITLTVKDASSTATIANGFSVTAGFLTISGGGTLKANGTIVLDGGDDVDGDHIGGGGSCTDAGSFISADALIIGNNAPQPGFSFSLAGGAVASCNTGKIGQHAGSYGIMTLSGAGTIWNCGQGLAVADQGEGELDMDTGAQLQLGGNSVFAVGLSAGGNGRLTADGIGTTIDARQALVSIGMEANAEGSMLLTNGASLMLDMDTFIGDSGSGSLTLSGGSQASIGLDTGAAQIKFGVGNAAGSNGGVSVQDTGGQFVMGRYVLTIVGVSGNGFFGVGNGGTVQTDSLELGAAPGAAGMVVLDGAGSSWTNADITEIGGGPNAQPGGAGKITLTNGAVMRAASNPRSECFISATGQIVLDATSAFAVGSGAYGPGGTLRVTSGGLLSGKGKQAGATVYNTNVTGKVIVTAGGKFKPGGDPDVFSIQGDCDLTDGGAGGGETDFEIGGAGTAGTDYDQLVVSGNVTLGGTLDLVLLPGYVPKAGDKLNVIQAGSITGSFAQIVAPGLTLKPVAGPGGLSVTVTAVAATTPPVVTSAATAMAYIGQPFSYQITATHSPAGYAASGLPNGLSLDTASGLITGTPTAAGASGVTVSATNVSGTGTLALALTVSGTVPAGAPVITSATSATGEVGSAFSYQIAASGVPTSFAANGLPGGLGVDPATGIISGTPTAAGTFAVGLTATNASGSGMATLTLTVTASASGVPTVTAAVAGDGMAAVGGEAGKVIVRRTGDTSAPLTVNYKVKGSARAGVDYKKLSGTVTIPAGAAQAKIKVKPLVSAASVVKIHLLPSTDNSYNLGGAVNAKVKIVDHD